MTAGRRWLLWAVLLLGVLAVLVFDRTEPAGGVVEAVPRPRAAGDAPQASARLETRTQAQAPTILPIRPRVETADVEDAFPIRDWRPRPPPPPALPPGPPPAPVAPEFPYIFFGKKLENGAWQVFLNRDERILVVKSGDTVDGSFRIEAIQPPQMTMTYLPMKQRQTMHIGDP